MTLVSTGFIHAYVYPAISAAYPLAGIAFPPLMMSRCWGEELYVFSSIPAPSSFPYLARFPSTNADEISEYCREITLALGSPRYRRVTNDYAVSEQGIVF